MNFKQAIKFYFLFIGLLLANIFKAQEQSKIESATSVTYAVVSIPYSPCSFTTGTQVLANKDDVWSVALNIGFNFNYFGRNYNSFTIGVNGQITFSTSLATGYDNWSIFNPIPNLTDMPGNTICASFRDIDPTFNGAIYYGTIGTAPNRHLIVSWDTIPLFGNPGNCSGYQGSTFQLVLHETTNCIDVFIDTSASCPSWNAGDGIIGIQDSTGTIGYSPPGRNYPNAWTAIHEGWRFIPSGSSCAAACGVATSIYNTKKNLVFEIYPNPSDGIYKVKTQLSECYIEIRNLLGEEMYHQQLNSKETEIDLKNLNNGIYYLKVSSKEGKNIYQTKIVKR